MNQSDTTECMNVIADVIVRLLKQVYNDSFRRE